MLIIIEDGITSVRLGSGTNNLDFYLNCRCEEILGVNIFRNYLKC